MYFVYCIKIFGIVRALKEAIVKRRKNLKIKLSNSVVPIIAILDVWAIEKQKDTDKMTQFCGCNRRKSKKQKNLTLIEYNNLLSSFRTALQSYSETTNEIF